MARTDARFREAYNKLLLICDAVGIGSKLPSELVLAGEIEVSRTVVRSALTRLQEQGLIHWQGRDKTVIRASKPEDQLTVEKESVSPEQLEAAFLNWILRFDVPPGTSLNVAKLSKQFEVASHTLQEFFAGLSRFGLVERRPRGGWVLLGFTENYAVELSEFRTVLELNAVRQFAALPADHPARFKLAELRQEHLQLLERIDSDYHDFSPLDESFHTCINSVVQNRFVSEFQKVISLIFHYHYQWDKSCERQRNEAAIREHLSIIDAMESGDREAAIDAASRHLATSKETLLSSLQVHNLV